MAKNKVRVRSNKKNYKNKKRSLKGGSCSNLVDTSRYTKGCANLDKTLPLDKVFQKHFQSGAGCGCGSKRKAIHPKRKAFKSKQKAGGFSMTLENIGNMSGRAGYSDCCPPLFLANGQTVHSKNFQPTCGQRGGGKVKTSNQKKNNKRNKKSANKKRYIKKSKGGGVKGMQNVDGVFTQDMSQREFGCKQPYWNPKCT